MQKARAINNVKKNFQQAENVLTSYAHQKKYTKRSVLELKITNTDFFAKIAMKTIITIYIVSSVSKYILIRVKMRMMINGLVVIIVNVGYGIYYLESYLM